MCIFEERTFIHKNQNLHCIMNIFPINSVPYTGRTRAFAMMQFLVLQEKLLLRVISGISYLCNHSGGQWKRFLLLSRRGATTKRKHERFPRKYLCKKLLHSYSERKSSLCWLGRTYLSHSKIISEKKKRISKNLVWCLSR